MKEITSVATRPTATNQQCYILTYNAYDNRALWFASRSGPLLLAVYCLYYFGYVYSGSIRRENYNLHV